MELKNNLFVDSANRGELIKFCLDSYWNDMLCYETIESEPGTYLFYLKDGDILSRECIVVGTWNDLWDNPYYTESMFDTLVEGRGMRGVPNSVYLTILIALGKPSYMLDKTWTHYIGFEK